MTTAPLPVMGAETLALPSDTGVAPIWVAPAKKVIVPVGAVVPVTKSEAFTVTVAPVVMLVTPSANETLTVGNGFGAALSWLSSDVNPPLPYDRNRAFHGSGR